jgi:hypothetical protein
MTTQSPGILTQSPSSLKIILMSSALKPLVFLLLCCLPGSVEAQDAPVSEVWVGYISSMRINERWSIWNDWHFVDNAFFASRHGATLQTQRGLRISGGYAYVATATPFTTDLVRHEHRPWAQVEKVFTLHPKWSFRTRFRYDARFRRGLEPFALSDSYVFYHRLRSMNSLRFTLAKFSSGSTLHLNAMDELLVNAGKQYTGPRIDQNRLYFMLGYTYREVTLLLGLHRRTLPRREAAPRIQQGLTLWVIQNFDLKNILWP